MSGKPHPLWDIPTRAFHWLIVILFALSWWSAEQQRFDIHEWSGYTVIVLVLTRILWGFMGSQHSRFSDFFVGSVEVFAYLRGKGGASAGHNPLGGWSVVVLLSLLLLQAVSGLFNSDDILFSGPLHFWANTEFRDTMGFLHDITFNALLGLIGLHLLAIAYYQFRRKQKLVQAMIRGSAVGREGRSAAVAWWPALLVAVVIAAALLWGLGQAPQPQPMQW